MMGLPPKGEIVARPMLVRACGCLQEFQHYAVDKYRARTASQVPTDSLRRVRRQARRRAAAAPEGRGAQAIAARNAAFLGSSA